MNIKQAKQEIKNTIRAYLAKDEFDQYRIPVMRQRPVLLMGPPGIGKTQIMEQIAYETGIALVAYTITHHTRQSALGLPFIQERKFGEKSFSVTEYTMSEILATVYQTMEDTGLREGILFLDEINCISETLAPMMLQFLQCKTFGNQKLPDGWIIVAAGNPPEYNKSVREFDVVTLDRVKRIDVEQDFSVWKEYAYQKGIHGAILTYLEIHKENFYAFEASADGVQFATARGWEDLSELLLTYEQMGIQPDREVIGQYIQLPRIARDFANYLELYAKYRQIYHIEDILSEHWTKLSAAELSSAPFDEKLSVLGLLIARLGESACACRRQEQLTEELHACLIRVKQAATSVSDALSAELQNTHTRLIHRLQAQNADPEEQRMLRGTAAHLERYLHVLEQERIPENAAFERVRELFQEQVAIRGEWVTKTGFQLNAAFAFLEEALGESQEMVIFATELTANAHTSWYIQNFGCDAYFRHNQSLLFDDTRTQILNSIAAAREE
ncbi:AAA family ATPase [uncultured Ruthenibacterium sp.]|uniref:ATP-binding protein n=1 Tax=uncultured Ruthenibacterium sp. TaxID=1905347 RepID=UPI00349E6356